MMRDTSLNANGLKALGAVLLAGTGLMLAGCGDRAAAPANNSALNMTSEPMIGNDASALETVANQPAPMDAMPPAPSSDNASRASNSSAAEPSGADSAPGGDRGGNVQSNVAGM